jgi:protoporphyrin/coproporphyrin ferrochelatase
MLEKAGSAMSFATGTQASIGVLLMAYGSPTTLDEVLPYYTDVRGGHAPSDEQLALVYDHYARIGGPTGLLEISQAQTAALQAQLDTTAPGAYRVYLGMRHWRPFIADTVRQMAVDGIRDAVAIALTPQDSHISVGGYIASVEKALAALAAEEKPTAAPAPAIHFTFVRSWRADPHFLWLLAQRVRAAREWAFTPAERDALQIIFSAHSLPERITTWKDPYPDELRVTVEGVTRLLELDERQWTFAYQSAGRTPEPWLGPSIQDAITQLAERGVRAALVCPVGFVADNLEILYDVDIELRNQAARLGIHLERIAMPNADPLLIEALATAVQRSAPAGGKATSA